MKHLWHDFLHHLSDDSLSLIDRILFCTVLLLILFSFLLFFGDFSLRCCLLSPNSVLVCIRIYLYIYIFLYQWQIHLVKAISALNLCLVLRERETCGCFRIPFNNHKQYFFVFYFYGMQFYTINIVIKCQFCSALLSNPFFSIKFL